MCDCISYREEIEKLRTALLNAAVALEDCHWDSGDQEFDSQGVKEAHAYIAEALGWNEKGGTA